MNNKGMKRWFLTVALTALLCMLLGSSAGASTYGKGIAALKQNNVKTANGYFKKLPQNANEKAVRNMKSKVKKAYLKVLKKYNFNHSFYGSYAWGYYLTDINKDKTPELIVKYGSCEADVRIDVYTFKKGKAKKVGKMYCGHTSFFYYPKGNGMVVNCTHMGYEAISVLKMSGGKLKTKLLLDRAIKGGVWTRLPYALSNHVL